MYGLRIFRESWFFHLWLFAAKMPPFPFHWKMKNRRGIEGPCIYLAPKWKGRKCRKWSCCTCYAEKRVHGWDFLVENWRGDSVSMENLLMFLLLWILRQGISSSNEHFWCSISPTTWISWFRKYVKQNFHPLDIRRIF